MHRLLIAILCLLALMVDKAQAQIGDGRYPLASAAAEEAFDQGYAAFNSKTSAPNYVEARRHYERAAELGHAGAMTNLGLIHSNGLGIKRDQRLATEWFERGSRAGDPGGTYNLALQYAMGTGAPRDLRKARQLYETAARAGNVPAMRNFAILLDEGQGGPRDIAAAHYWYEQGAQRGDAGAMTNLGYRYATGRGVPVDREKARELYKKAIAAGDSTGVAAGNLANLDRPGNAGNGRSSGTTAADRFNDSMRQSIDRHNRCMTICGHGPSCYQSCP